MRAGLGDFLREHDRLGERAGQIVSAAVAGFGIRDRALLSGLGEPFAYHVVTLGVVGGAAVAVERRDVVKFGVLDDAFGQAGFFCRVLHREPRTGELDAGCRRAEPRAEGFQHRQIIGECALEKLHIRLVPELEIFHVWEARQELPDLPGVFLECRPVGRRVAPFDGLLGPLWNGIGIEEVDHDPGLPEVPQHFCDGLVHQRSARRVEERADDAHAVDVDAELLHPLDVQRGFRLSLPGGEILNAEPHGRGVRPRVVRHEDAEEIEVFRAEFPGG